MNNQEYLNTILSLFDKTRKEYAIGITKANNNILDTGIITYTFYKYNLFPYSVATNIIHDTIIADVPEPIKDDTDISNITVSAECCNFIDRMILFMNNKFIKKSKSTQELNISYMSYLMLTDKTLIAYNIFQKALSSRHRGYAVKTLKELLLEAYSIPNDPALQAFGRFLTDPFSDNLNICVGRDKEISDIVDILSRRKKNNPVLVGQPGVGKTAIIEGFANLLMSSKCPKQFQGYHLYELSLATMLSGARYRGDFEERLEQLLKVITTNNDNIILYIDEIHNIVCDSKESSTSGMSAADILKPYMSRQGFYLIGATTEQEYKVIQKDKALDRRFSIIRIKEPTVENAKDLICRCINDYENHFSINIDKSLIGDIVDLSSQYIPNKYLPDKAFDLLDESCVQCVNHSKDNSLKINHIISATELISGIKIPTTKTFDKHKVDKLIQSLKNSIIGQDTAIMELIRCLKRYFIGLNNNNKPIGSFLFVGPTGTGKTALCKEIASNIFTRESFIRIDMSEYMEKHSVSRLIGAPPGYVGYGKGGELTEAVKNNPFSVILFDEVEKAHPDVFNTLLQILDDGRITDTEGYTVNFNHCIIVLTSNIGAEEVKEKTSTTIGFGNTNTTADIKRIYEKSIKRKFKPEFLNRLDNIIYFNSLTKDNIALIVDKELDVLINKFKDINITITVTADTKNRLVDKCYSPDYGARYAQRIITSDVEDLIVNYLVENDLLSSDNVKLLITLNKDKQPQVELETVSKTV